MAKRINKDSALWEEAYRAYKRSQPYAVGGKVKITKQATREYIEPSTVTNTQQGINIEIKRIDLEIAELRRKRKQLTSLLVSHDRTAYEAKPYILYALRLQNDCWYIGITKNIDKRYRKHASGKGAVWTKRYAPVEVYYTELLNTSVTSEAAHFEDKLTLKYANMFGTSKVRGGGYCQMHPVWPNSLVKNVIEVR